MVVDADVEFDVGEGVADEELLATVVVDADPPINENCLL